MEVGCYEFGDGEEARGFGVCKGCRDGFVLIGYGGRVVECDGAGLWVHRKGLGWDKVEKRFGFLDVGRIKSLAEGSLYAGLVAGEETSSKTFIACELEIFTAPKIRQEVIIVGAHG